MLGVQKRWLYSLCGIVALVLFFGWTATAQQVFGSIYGTITDPSGAPVNNAKITITDVAKGTTFTVTTDASGNYTKTQLIPDPYTVTVEATGFQKAVSNEITVQVDQASKYDASLQVGSVNQTVEVTASVPLLQTDRADVAQTFTAQQLSQLPNIGRNLQSFELLNPGTVKMPWQHASDEDPQGSVQTVVNGQLFSATGYELDGTTNQDPILGIIVVNPTIDSVNEVKQANQDFDAEFEYTGGGLLTYSTKSGSNSFHGDAFEYLELNTPGFNDYARNPFSEPTGAPPQHFNQFGGSIGGRIIKDKLFFFGDAQLTRNHQGASVLTTVPTPEERGIGVTGGVSLLDWLQASPGYPGCLTAAGGCLYQIYNPATGNPATGQGRAPFVNNFIPTAALSPQALALLKYFPLPNTVTNGTPYINNYAASGIIDITGNQWNTRWDYYANEKNSFFGRYSYAGYSQGGPGAFGLEAGGPALTGGNIRYAGQSSALNQSVAAGWTHTASASLLNEMRFGYMRYHVVDSPNGLGTTPATDAGIPGLNLTGPLSQITSGMPGFNIDEPGGIGASAQGNTTGNIFLGYALNTNGCNCPLTELEDQFQFVDNVSKISGNHNFKVGADIRYARNLRVPSDAHRAGLINFDPGITGIVLPGSTTATGGLGLATFLLGDVGGQTGAVFQRYYSTVTDAAERQKRFFFYAQDEWHATPKLTFTYGFRWELIFPETVNGIGNGASANMNTGLMEVYGVGLVSDSGYQAMNWHNLAPRISLAYQVTPKLVARAGYGWSYNLGTFGSTFGHNVTQNPPVLTFQTISPTNNYSDVFTLAQGPPLPATYTVSPNGTFPIPAGVNVKIRPAIMTLPTVYQYNAALQYQLTPKVAVSAMYVGNSTRHGFLGPSTNNVNENDPLFVPGNTNTALTRPFNGELGPRYDYGLTQDVTYYCNCFNAEYNSFQGLINIKAAAGYTLQGNYTYQVAKADSGTSTYDQSYYALYDRSLGWGNIDYLPHQQWVFAQNYDIPFGRGRKFGSNANRFVDAVLGGWNISGITTYYSGIPFSPTIDNYGPSPTAGRPNTGPNNRPDLGTGDPYAGAPGNRSGWFSGCPAGNCTSGPFLWPAANTFGNYPVNTLYGPHFINQDLSLMKQFSITERIRFMLRADATNVFNHTNLGLPNQDVQSPSVGQITQTAFGGYYLMRRIQYSGTFTW